MTTKRMRVFAGPNGSGKSSVIKAILRTKVGRGRSLDFGIYINADDIAVALKKEGLNFTEYKIEATIDDLTAIVEKSGLISCDFSLKRFRTCTILEKNFLKVDKNVAEELNDNPYERIAQILADYLRKKMLAKGEKFSFETVFSHPSKVDIIKQAKDNDYKVYLYFVSTEDPEINVYRVKEVRVKQKGHDVEKSKIVDRYYRSMDLLYDAAQYCYQVYFFDNSKNGAEHTMFAHFKVDRRGKKQWDDISDVPEWFKKYYSKKVKNIT